MNVTKATLEGRFADELAKLQPTPGYMRLLKESVLQIWKARKAAVRQDLARAEQAAKTIQERLDRLDEAFLFDNSASDAPYRLVAAYAGGMLMSQHPPLPPWTRGLPGLPG